MVHCTGLLANLLNIATLWRQRKLVTYKIFLAMAVADLAVSLLSSHCCCCKRDCFILSGSLSLEPAINHLPQLFGEHHDLSTSCNDFA